MAVLLKNLINFILDSFICLFIYIYMTIHEISLPQFKATIESLVIRTTITMKDSEPSKKKIRSSDSVNDSDLPYSDKNTRESDLLKEADAALQESNRRHIKPVVEESKLGIELFVGDTKHQYHGLVKTRYADFIVHEVDLDGNIAELTNLEAPEEEEPCTSMKLEDIFSRKALVCMSNVNSGLLESYKIDVTGMDKDMRTSVHQAIRASYDRLESSTVSEYDNQKEEQNGNKEKDDNVKPDSTQQVEDEPDSSKGSESNLEKADSNESVKAEEKKYIVVTRRSKMSRPKSVWPRSRPDHTHFVLYKENKDTMDAIHNLAAATNSKPSYFSYAGTKDRRAVTSQWVSSWRLEPKRLIGAMRRFNRRPYLKVGNFSFKKDPIRLGQLKANRFDIVIRHLVHNSEGVKVIDLTMNAIKDNGFVNYFGLQRFGTRSIQTHEVGLAILQGKWDKAVDLILSYRYDDSTQPLPSAQDNNSETTKTENNNNNNEASQPVDSQKLNRGRHDNKNWKSGAEQHNACIDLWKSKLDADQVFKKYPHFKHTNEGMIIRSLSKSEDSKQDFSSALSSLPRNTRSMYVHSYQSLIWNKLTTHRLKKYGFGVVPGDLILSPDANVTDDSLDILLATDEADSDNIKLGESEADPCTSTDQRKTFLEDVESKVVVATEENLDKFTIFDVVLPLIGSRVKLPTNEVGQELDRLLKNDELTTDNFKARERVFVSYGSYRKIMVKPEHLSWSIKQYSHPHENLVETDLDRINRTLSNKNNEAECRPASPLKSDSSDEALIVSFELPPSSYATMCLREIMKKPSTEFNNRF